MLSKLRTSNFFGGDIVRTERDNAKNRWTLAVMNLVKSMGKPPTIK